MIPTGFASHREIYFSVPVVAGPPDGGKAVRAGDDHIVGAEGTVDDQQISPLVPSAHNANVGVLRVKHQVAGQGLVPGDGCAVGVLGVGAPAMADDVLAAGDVVEYPVHKAGAVHPVGPVGAGGGAARRRHLTECAPGVIPADGQGFYSDR